MKYRIIKRGDKEPYYYAQYIDEDTGLWETVEKNLIGVGIMTPYRTHEKFATPKAARKALRKIARQQHEASLARVIEECVL